MFASKKLIDSDVSAAEKKAEGGDNLNICATCSNSYTNKNLRTHEKSHAGTLPFTYVGKRDFFRVIFFLHLFYSAGALECFSCTNIQDQNQCNSTIKCGADEFCSHTTSQSGSGKVYSLGCAEHSKCGVKNTGPGVIVGRDIEIRQTPECHECCSSDFCNKNLCAHLIPSDCVDDENYDCAELNTVFEICKNIDKAKITCPRFCNLCNVVDGNWSPWSSWTQCDVTCGNGTETRIRSCSNPKPANGGLDCLGNSNDTMSCEQQLCPVHGGWSEWTEFGHCTVTCGMGMSKRVRSCLNPAPSRFGDHCFGEGVEYTLCMPKPCTDGSWSDWEPWGKCTSCDIGVVSRTRNCNKPKPSPYGNYCTGQSLQVEGCNSYCIDSSDCYDIKKKHPGHQSGIYFVQLWKSKKHVSVYCDMDTDNGGWTVFQNRFNGSVGFYRNFANYTNGFGDLTGEFWLGLESLHEMTSHGSSELRVDVQRANGSTAYEMFKNFSISSSPDYVLHVLPGTGTAGDQYCALSANSGAPFSTYDRTNNTCSLGSCATNNHGAWWYNTCVNVNLNGKYCTPGTTTCSWRGMTYYHFSGWESLKTSKMMFRRIHT